MDRWHLDFNDDRLLVYNVSGFSFRAKMNCMSGLDLVDIYFTAFLDCDLSCVTKRSPFLFCKCIGSNFTMFQNLGRYFLYIVIRLMSVPICGPDHTHLL